MFRASTSRRLSTMLLQQQPRREASSVTMLRVVKNSKMTASRSSPPHPSSSASVRAKSTSTQPSSPPAHHHHHPLEADAGTMGTKIHHTLAHSMAIVAPLYFIIPDSKTETWMHRTFGVLLGANMGMHAWIGLNYVATDYVPKVSKALLGPARVVTAGMALTILLGMAKISVFSPGGIKGVIKGVWNGKAKDKFDF